MIRIELILQIYAKPCSKVVDKINALLSNIWKFQFPNSPTYGFAHFFSIKLLENVSHKKRNNKDY